MQRQRQKGVRWVSLAGLYSRKCNYYTIYLNFRTKDIRNKTKYEKRRELVCQTNTTPINTNFRKLSFNKM